MEKKKAISQLESKWRSLIFALSIVSIVTYLLLSFGHFGRIHNIAIEDFPLIFLMVLGGIPITFQIIIKMFKGDLGADSLAVIAIITAAYLGSYLACSLIIFMLASGQVLENYALGRASAVLRLLAQRMPSKAHLKQGSDIVDIEVSHINIGDVLVLYPHEICPVDSIVIEGHGGMDESYLTGEPYLVTKAPGVMALSGAINGDSMLLLHAQKRPQDSRYAKIMKVMEESEQHRPHLRRLGDQLGALFAPFALIIAAATWYLSGDPLRFLSVLVIATPCPLLIAIPITIISAISLAAKTGIIIKDPLVLERLPTCRTAIFDKTGTLTYGQASLVDIFTFEGFDREEILQLTASLERYSKHPLAKAILTAAETSNLPLFEATVVSEKPGHGLTGQIQNHKVHITHRKKLLQTHPQHVNVLPHLKPGMECIILIDDQMAAVMQFRDTLRAEGHSFISHLKPMHHFEKVMMVSGDRPEEVEYLAKQLDIKETYSSQTPEQKLALVRAETVKAPTLFMGDGINDAPALTAATVGLAVGQHETVTAEAAGAVILENTLSKVDALLHISTCMRRIALQSALGGMLLSGLGMAFAAAGFIGPVAGALLQEVIDALAIFNALRLTWKTTLPIHIKNT